MTAPIYARQTHLLLIEPAFRQALLDRHKWVFHETSYGAVQSIRNTELRVCDPGVIDGQLLELIDRTLGREARLMVFLKTVASHVEGSSLGRQVKFALCRKDVPARIGVDWSSDATTLALTKVPNAMPPAAAFVKVVEEAGSFASYDPIISSLLRISPAAAPGSDPAGWPRLVDLRNDTDIARF